MPDRSPSGLGHLTIQNGSDDDAAVKVARVGSTRAYRYYYVRKGETITIRGIAPGDYEVLIRTGTDWDREKRKFRFYEALSKTEGEESVMEFAEERTETGTRYAKWSLTLHPVIGGNVQRKPISEEDFGED
jgi:hypothetical protein